MPTSTQALYFHLLSEADDDGFVSSPKMVMRIVGSTVDEINILISKKFIIPFDGSLCVVKHWRMHNQVRKDRYIETKYLKQKMSLYIRGNGAYTTNPTNAVPVPKGYFTVENIDKMLLATTWQPTVALGKGRLGKDSIGETSVSQEKTTSKKKTLDMAWKPYNENAHADDLPSVGDDGQIAKEKPKAKHVCYQVFGLFKEVLDTYPLNWNVNKSQRIACENLMQERGIEQIRKALEFYEENQDKEFCPLILSPWDLDTKWKKLVEFREKL